MSIEISLINSIFDKNLEQYLLDIMLESTSPQNESVLDNLDVHSLTVYCMALDHLKMIIKHGANRHSYVRIELAPKESGLPRHRRYELSNPDGFEAWIHFGCPPISPSQMQRIVRECEPAPRPLTLPPPRPADNRPFDYHAHRATIVGILEDFGPVRLRNFILENQESGLPACYSSMDRYSKSILKTAIEHLDALASTPSEEERLTLPFRRHFDAWMVGLCPGMRTYGAQFEACFPSKPTSAVTYT